MKIKNIVAAVSLVREQLVAVAVKLGLLYIDGMYKKKGYRTWQAPEPHHNQQSSEVDKVFE